jgi:hypothetical protein
MVEDKKCEAPHQGGAAAPRIYSPELQPLMQSLLATLANIDLEYEHEIKRVGRSSTGAGVKTYLMERLKERHQERRSPYVRELAALERRIQRDWAA